MTDYRPLLTKIVRLADRGTFVLRDYGPQRPPFNPIFRWQACVQVKGRHAHHYGRSPGIAVRKLLAMLEKNAAAGRARRSLP